MQELNKILLFLVLSFVVQKSASAQQRKAVTVQQRTQSEQEFKNQSFGSTAKWRMTANYNYTVVNPQDLNSTRSQTLWAGTTTTDGNFNGLSGFSVSAEYKIDVSYLGVEFVKSSQDLYTTAITGANYNVQDSAEVESLYLLYSRAYQDEIDTSYEWGLGLGWATKFRFHNVVSTSSIPEDLYWQDSPFLLKIFGSYNYHFSDNVRFRAGGGYEYAVSSSLKADSNHPAITAINGQPIVEGQAYQNASGENVKMDLSGLRIQLGLAVAF